MSAFIDQLKARAKNDIKKIVLAEGEDLRTIQAAAIVKAEGYANVVLIGNVDKIKSIAAGEGYNALTGVYGNMIEMGIVDPVKVTRSALQNAASVAAMVLTTESLVADKPEPIAAAPAMDPSMGGMY